MMAFYEDVEDQLDAQLEKLVVDAKIPTQGLETAAFQDELLNRLLDLRMLSATIDFTKDRAEIKKDSTDDLSEYCAGTDKDPGMDEPTKKKLLQAGYKASEIDAFDDQLVFARNRNWIPKLDKLLANGDVFIAVGADHLIGKPGVVELLRARGYEVTRVTH
jgi:uncharacterized protein YbaP (TraB family)